MSCNYYSAVLTSQNERESLLNAQLSLSNLGKQFNCMLFLNLTYLILGLFVRQSRRLHNTTSSSATIYYPAVAIVGITKPKIIIILTTQLVLDHYYHHHVTIYMQLLFIYMQICIIFPVISRVERVETDKTLSVLRYE